MTLETSNKILLSMAKSTNHDEFLAAIAAHAQQIDELKHKHAVCEAGFFSIVERMGGGRS